ncbi:tetratricopeptide repeat protein [Algivirga pacifica]|uniref:Tetratricopeptide repeat-containing protein n=1 Tax=Algivirga pacifica TaxID=1162670 RepID=A0ABP9DMJ7_9BACT
MRFIFIITFFLISTFSVYAKPFQNSQEEIDSLTAHWEEIVTEAAQLEALLKVLIFYMENDMDKAMQYIAEFELAIDGAENHPYKGRLYNTYGNIYFNQLLYMQSTKYYMKAAEVFESIGDQEGLLAVYNNIGLIYGKQQDFQNASQYMEKALKLANNNASNKKISGTREHILLNLGVLNIENADTLQGSIYYNKALELALASKNQEIEAKVYHNQGQLFQNKSEYSSAIKLYQKALALKQKLGSNHTLVSTYCELANCYLALKSFDSALPYLQKAEAIANSITSDDIYKEVHEAYYQYYLSKNNDKKALFHLQKFSHYKEKINLKESASKISALIKQYEFEKEQRLQEAKEKAFQVRIYIIMTILLALTAITIVLYLLQKSKAKNAYYKEQQAILKHQRLALENEKLQQDVNFKNKELTSNIMHLMQKNELINKVTEELLKLQKSLKVENRKPVRQVIFSLQSSVEDQMWNSFEAHFQQVHKDFYERLHEKYPDLTANERKLCAFLRLNLSTKDISSITLQSPKAINMARFRLRKKLGINGEDTDLHAFLANF